jgi:hypothetical protein
MSMSRRPQILGVGVGRGIIVFFLIMKNALTTF